MEELKKLYADNEKFRDYVDKFAKQFNITPEKALSYKVIQIYAQEVKRGLKNV